MPPVSIQPSLALEPVPTPVCAITKGARLIQAASILLPLLEQGSPITTPLLREAMRQAFGASDSQGSWQWKDAYEACEAALVLFLRKYRGQIIAHAPSAAAVIPMLAALGDLLPTHTRRSEESTRYQQFSTPLELAFIAAQAAAITARDHVLEPSAGTGMLAIHAAGAAQALTLNELAATRADILQGLFPDALLMRINAEHIDDYLPRALAPSVVLMNPPFSARANIDKPTGRADILHIAAALKRLAPGGRLVAITGPACEPGDPRYADHFAKLNATARIVFSAALTRGFFNAHGTNIESRLTVIDKIPATYDTSASLHRNVADPLALLALVERYVPPRSVIGAEPRPIAPKPLSVFAAPQKRVVAAKATPMASPVTQDIIELSYAPCPAQPPSIAPSQNLYEPYRLETFLIEGAKPHPSKFVQSAAMASVKSPMPSYRPHLPRAVIDDGILSDVQLESIIQAGEAHSRLLSTRWIVNESYDKLEPAQDDTPGAVQFRRGWALGDGTGCGKGRQIAGIVLDNWLKGRRRALWISKNPELLIDAQRDWDALGQEKLQVIPQSKYAADKPIDITEGILYTTYATLRSAPTGKKSRLQQILDWLGPDFDGVIALDEAHAMGNAAPGATDRGKVAPSQQGLAGLRLQNALPDARVVYASATAGTIVENLSYMTRLGFWGSDDFPFTTRAEFIQAMHAGGLPAMEVLARDAKALGLYAARSLSYEDVEVDMLVHELSSQQIAIYDKFADAFQIIHNNLSRALDAAGITSPDHGTLNGQAKASARGAFESNKQRFFNHLITAMKVPSLIKAIENDLSENRAPVIQLVTTSEALMERRLLEIPPSEWNDLNIDITPREIVTEYLSHAFPVQLYETYTDDEGNLHSRPALDGDGNPVLCREAEQMRDAMLEELQFLPPVQSALDQILHHFGTDVVAEITGRSRRIVRKTASGGRSVLAVENRSGAANLAEADAFMDGRKQILVFSDAGGTGRSYHASLTVKNQHRRVHYVLEPGWKADAAIQGLGRTNRTNQTSAPICRPVATNVRGEKRFLSTIARRLYSLGAITKGQRQTGGQGLFRPEDNLESAYAYAALNTFYWQMIRGKIPECSLAEFQDITGLSLIANDGAVSERLPPMHTFLNRLLALRIDLQNALFHHLEEILAGKIEAAIADGSYEIGLETITAESLVIASRRVVERHASGAETLLYEIDRKTRNHPRTLSDILGIAQAERGRFLRNEQSGRAGLLVGAPTRTHEDGTVERRYRILRPMDTDYLSETSLHLSAWKDCDAETFSALWTQQLDELPEFVTSRLLIVTGLLLPVWKRLPEDYCAVYRLTTDDGERVIGRPIGSADLPRLGIAPAFSNPDEAYQHIMQGGRLQLTGGMTLRKTLAMYEPRIELSGYDHLALPALKAMGLITEIIAHTLRVFVPIGDKAPAIIERLLKRYPPTVPA